MTKKEREAHRNWLRTLKNCDEVGVQDMVGEETLGRPWIAIVLNSRGHGDGAQWLVGTDDRRADAARWYGINGRTPKNPWGPSRMLTPVTDTMRRARRLRGARTALQHGIDWSTKSDDVVEATITAYEKAEQEERNAEK
ncbi:MAG: hypothetical protein QG571_1293 [Pseudomonadota bacterium]|nr:hypothetical protein [Pseudomonadota bacterium]